MICTNDLHHSIIQELSIRLCLQPVVPLDFLVNPLGLPLLVFLLIMLHLD